MPSTAPVQVTADALHALAKAGLSAVPIIGGPAAELFQYFIQPPLQRRQLAWMQQVGQELKRLELCGLDLQSLQTNEAFVTAAIRATHIAIRTHSAEKLNSLKNALTSIAIAPEHDESQEQLFLTLIDDLTVDHIRILSFLNAPPPESLQFRYKRMPQLLEEAIPSLKGRLPFYYQLMQDLYNRGLLSTSLHRDDHLSPADLRDGRTTHLGKAFVAFIQGAEA
jgi:hypothetical protein